VRVYLENMPTERSALAVKMYGEAHSWGAAEHLLALACDQIASLSWMYASAHRKEHSAAPERPEPVIRPGTSVPSSSAASVPADGGSTRRRKPASMRELREFMNWVEQDTWVETRPPRG
jgi:hypothetical protein